MSALDAGRVAPLIAASQAAAGDAAAIGALAPASQPGTAAGGVKAVQSAARSAAQRLRAVGINLTLGPIADVGYSAGPADGIAFSDDPARVARLTAAALAGWRSGRVLTAVGHFPGQGAASQDPLEGPATVGLGRDELDSADLLPFAAVASSAPAITVSNAAYAAYGSVTPATQTPIVLHELLRGQLGFTGVAVSDDLSGAAAATGTTVADAAVAALAAGTDLLYIPDPAEVAPAYDAVLDAVREGKLPLARLREAVIRILELKRAAGLL